MKNEKIGISMLNKINVAYSTNNSYLTPTAVSITSLLENNKTHNIFIHILYSDISAENIAKLRSFEDKYPNATIVFHKVEKKIFDRCRICINYISIETYYRYLLPDLLQDDEKVLYLDGDTVVVGDISELFDVNLNGFYGAGVEDVLIKKEEYAKALNLNSLYINAGVILFNLKEMRQDRITDKLFALTESRQFRYQDQDVINLTFAGKIKELSCIYNYKRRAHIKQFPELKDKVVIVHFPGDGKPWIKNTFNPSKLKYYKYESLSPFFTKPRGFCKKLHRCLVYFLFRKGLM